MGASKTKSNWEKTRGRDIASSAEVQITSHSVHEDGSHGDGNRQALTLVDHQAPTLVATTEGQH